MNDHAKRITEKNKWRNKIINCCYACGITWSWLIFLPVAIVIVIKQLGVK